MRGEFSERHLDEEQMMEAYFLAEGHPHLDGCPACRARYDSLVQLLEDVRDDAVRAADAVFTADRLGEQRDRILRRLERHGHPAEVLRFPSRFDGRRASHLFGPARRWVAAAAAAGLVAGVFLGFAVDRRVGAAGAANTARLQLTATASSASWQRASAQDEQMLSEIEDALTGETRRVGALRALDAMTIPPDLQEVSFVTR